MANEKLPTVREAVILGILVNGEKYGREIRDAYVKQTSKGMPYGSLYVTLDRMERQGLIKPRMGDSPDERGGSRRKYFRITAKGHRSLDAFEILASRLRGETSHA